MDVSQPPHDLRDAIPLLTPQEAEGLFATLRALARGGLSTVLISHKLGEVLAVADRVAVLRGGRLVADRPVLGADRGTLAALMVGRDVAPTRRDPHPPGDPVLELERVSVPAPRGRVGLLDASLRLRAGEVVGVAGVAGIRTSGRRRARTAGPRGGSGRRRRR